MVKPPYQAQVPEDLNEADLVLRQQEIIRQGFLTWPRFL